MCQYTRCFGKGLSYGSSICMTMLKKHINLEILSQMSEHKIKVKYFACSQYFNFCTNSEFNGHSDNSKSITQVKSEHSAMIPKWEGVRLREIVGNWLAVI